MLVGRSTHMVGHYVFISSILLAMFVPAAGDSKVLIGFLMKKDKDWQCSPGIHPCILLGHMSDMPDYNESTFLLAGLFVFPMRIAPCKPNTKHSRWTCSIFLNTVILNLV